MKNKFIDFPDNKFQVIISKNINKITVNLKYKIIIADKEFIKYRINYLCLLIFIDISHIALKEKIYKS